MQRDHGQLCSEAYQEDDEEDRLDGTHRHWRGLDDGDHVKGVRAAPHVEVESKDAGEHQETGRLSVEEELESGIPPSGSPPDCDEEVHRHQLHLPEDVEEEEVQGHEDAEYSGLHEEDHGVELPDSVLLAPGEDDR